jgi:hypothetical protein
MANDSKKVSELTVTTSLSANDRLVVLANPNTSGAAVKTITSTTFANSVVNYIPKANSSVLGIVRVGNNIVSVNGVISTSYSLPNSSIVGYTLTVNSSGNSAWSAFTGVNNVRSIFSGTSNSVSSEDSVLLVNPYVSGANVTIILPIESAIEGKEILIKNVDATGNKKVRITTDDAGNPYLEDPVTGQFVTYYDLQETGQAETWIHDGSVYRHLNTARATPIFFTNANTYAQVVVKNSSNGVNASTDLVLYNNAGDEAAGTGPYIDLGINSNTYSNSSYSIGGFSDGYLFNVGGNLTVGTSDDKSIIFHANGTTVDKRVLTINSTAVSINSTSVSIAGLLQAPQSTKQNNSTGTVGQICWDGDYIYVCTATNVWKRATLNTF